MFLGWVVPNYNKKNYIREISERIILSVYIYKYILFLLYFELSQADGRKWIKSKLHKKTKHIMIVYICELF
jgi:hypothetical protein